MSGNVIRELLAWSTYTVLCAINTNYLEDSYSSVISDRLVSHRQKPYKTFISTILPLFQTSLIPMLVSSEYQSFLFEKIIPQLYSNRCLEVLNDLSNKLMINPSSQHRDIMTELMHNIDISQISDLKRYWLCVLALSAKFVIKFELFMGIRYLTSQQVDYQLVEPYLSTIQSKLQ